MTNKKGVSSYAQISHPYPLFSLPVTLSLNSVKLILLPGMDGTGKLFAEFRAALPDEYEIEIVQYPSDRFLSYSELENLVWSTCPATESFVLIAESFSTPLAIRCAARDQENLKGMILCAGFVASPVKGWRRVMARILAPLLFHLPLPAVAAKFWLVGFGASSPLIQTIRPVLASVSPKVLSARLRAVLECDVRAAFQQVQAPVLYLQAREDRLVDASCVEEFKCIHAAVRVEILDGPHLLLQREPLNAAQVITSFLQTL
ncbi:MAG: alpha/beta hydrolase [Acidobacteriaceae bacterium]|nr:alpha/beta hydrolase [Acidobacteriaceae bacterium]